MQNRKEIVMINVSNIYPHPDNPRKDVGDVTELAESIKKQGVMQNLTVIPLPALRNSRMRIQNLCPVIFM